MAMTEDEKLQRIIAEQRHKDLVGILQKIADTNDRDLLERLLGVMEKNGADIAAFADGLKNMPAPKVELNQKELISSLTELGGKIMDGQQQLLGALGTLIEMQAQPKEWDFKVEKEFGRITKVKAIQIK